VTFYLLNYDIGNGADRRRKMSDFYMIRMWGETGGREVFNQLIGPVTYDIAWLFLINQNGFEAVGSAKNIFHKNSRQAIWITDKKTGKPITATPVAEQVWAVLELLTDLLVVKLADNNDLPID